MAKRVAASESTAKAPKKLGSLGSISRITPFNFTRTIFRLPTRTINPSSSLTFRLFHPRFSPDWVR